MKGNVIGCHSLAHLITKARRYLLYYGKPVNTGSWQGIHRDDLEFIEVMNISLQAPVPSDLDTLRELVKPNLPWADDHFEERVSGQPLNPGEQYKNWPFYFEDKFRTEGGKFTHTYMERYWPKFAGGNNHLLVPLMGIRYEYGDLNDLVDLLRREPFTRQAYLPVWFPEDTGVLHRGRVPCTLGYQFFIRDNWEMSVTYYIRSCDYVRHFRDDIYLTCRLLLWIIDKLKDSYPQLKPSYFVIHIGSLHIFASDRYSVEKEEKNEQKKLVEAGKTS